MNKKNVGRRPNSSMFKLAFFSLVPKEYQYPVYLVDLFQYRCTKQRLFEKPFRKLGHFFSHPYSGSHKTCFVDNRKSSKTHTDFLLNERYI